jgi:CubicO group peptidase (beta-lactamase class C family)
MYKTWEMRPMAIQTGEIEAVVQEALRSWRVPGAAIAVVQGDDLNYIQGFGVREGGRADLVTPDTLFAIGSVTKSFTATAIAMLVDDGKMAWDDPVRKHIEFFRLSDPLANEHVTIRDLLAHRTGLGRHDILWYRSPWEREELIRRMGRVALEHSFRSKHAYQNLMYLAAGYAAGRAAGSTWERLVKKRLLDPLGMTGANFSTTGTEESSDHASPHRLTRDGAVEVIPWCNLDNVAPAGAINAGARDMSRWLRFQLGDGEFEGNRLVSAAQLAETKTPQMVMRLEEWDSKTWLPFTTQMSYGLGWRLMDYRGRQRVWHTGGIDGFSALADLAPELGLGIVVLTNMNGSYMPTAVANTLVDLALVGPTTDWNAYLAEQWRQDEERRARERKERDGKRREGTRPSQELTAYTGEYEEPAYGTAHISLEDGTLFLSWSSFHVRLDHFHFDTFTLTGADWLEGQRISFSLNAEGEVAAMSFLDRQFRKVGRATAVLSAA